jgi:hypothetical protein
MRSSSLPRCMHYKKSLEYVKHSIKKNIIKITWHKYCLTCGILINTITKKYKESK